MARGLWVLLAIVAFASAMTLDSDLENLVNSIEREVQVGGAPSEEYGSMVGSSEEEETDDIEDAVNTDATTVTSLRIYLEDCLRKNVQPNLQGDNVEQMASKIWDEESRGLTDGVLKNHFETKENFDNWAKIPSKGDKKDASKSESKTEKKAEKKAEKALEKEKKKEREAKKELQKEKKKEKKTEKALKKEKAKNLDARAAAFGNASKKSDRKARRANRSEKRRARRAEDGADREARLDKKRRDAALATPINKVFTNVRAAAAAPVAQYRSPKFRATCERTIKVLDKCQKVRVHPRCNAPVVRRDAAIVAKKLDETRKKNKAAISKVRTQLSKIANQVKTVVKTQKKNEASVVAKLKSQEKKNENRLLRVLRKNNSKVLGSSSSSSSSLGSKLRAAKKAEERALQQEKKAERKEKAAEKAAEKKSEKKVETPVVRPAVTVAQKKSGVAAAVKEAVAKVTEELGKKLDAIKEQTAKSTAAAKLAEKTIAAFANNNKVSAAVNKALSNAGLPTLNTRAAASLVSKSTDRPLPLENKKAVPAPLETKKSFPSPVQKQTFLPIQKQNSLPVKTIKKEVTTRAIPVRKGNRKIQASPSTIKKAKAKSLKKIKLVKSSEVTNPKRRAARLINWFKSRPGRLQRFKKWLKKRAASKKGGNKRQATKSLLKIIKTNKRRAALRKLSASMGQSKRQVKIGTKYRSARWARRELRKSYLRYKKRQGSKKCNWMCRLRLRRNGIRAKKAKISRRRKLSKSGVRRLKKELKVVRRRLKAVKRKILKRSVSKKKPSKTLNKRYRKLEERKRRVKRALKLRSVKRQFSARCGWWCRLKKRQARRKAQKASLKKF